VQVQANPAVLVPNVVKDGSLGQLTGMNSNLENLVTLYPEVVATSIPLDHTTHAKHSSAFGKKILNYQIGCAQIKAE
jgi:hypothetical protein